MGKVLELPDYVAGNGVSVPDDIVIGSGPAGYFAVRTPCCETARDPTLG
jgi:hypothetical protein